MREFTLLFVLVAALACSCSGPNTNELKNQKNQLEVTSALDDSPSEFPGVDFSSLANSSADELRLARNSVFAKYGRTFESDDLKEHFENQSWYVPNENFSRDIMSEEDKNIVKLISFLEEDQGVLWMAQDDLDGDGVIELCLFVESKDHKSGQLMINGESIVIINNWMVEEFSDEEWYMPNVWVNLSVNIIDVTEADNQKEILFTQRFCDDYDPGMENLLITKYQGKVQTFEFGINSYEVGDIKLLENDQFEIIVSDCPYHTKTYTVSEGELVLVDEYTDDLDYDCAACFVGNSMIEIGNGVRKKISELKSGDVVLGYDTKTGLKTETLVKEIVSVIHTSLVELIFDHDTITSTLDHPYFIKGKGWCSFKPIATNANYSNYKLFYSL